MVHTPIKLDVGVAVIYNEQKYTILKVVDEATVIARMECNQTIQAIPVIDLLPYLYSDTDNKNLAQLTKQIDLSILSSEAWQMALKRYEIIKEIADKGSTMEVVQSVAKENNVSMSSVYEWIRKYRQCGYVSCLLNKENNGGKGKSRLLPEVNEIVKTVIAELYLNSQKVNAVRVSREIAIKCIAADLPIPDPGTVRNRIKAISEEQKLRMRYGNAAADKFNVIKGNFPGADYPLAVIQIDHTELDIIIVDELYRKPVGRPWITMAIDVFSRMITAFYISLEKPSALSTGLCVSRSILTKETWMSKINVKGEWPCYGIMRSLHLDNGKDFHSEMLERSCQEYGILIDFRPVETPNYGGHIERLLGTVLDEIHTLPGTTFSDISDRKNYDSEGKACLTITELEKWLTEFIVNVYHKRFHTSINNTPLAKYQEGLSGNAQQPGPGMRRPLMDELKVKLDFMPFEERSIQQYGVMLGHICYYHDVLRKWMHTYQIECSKSVIKRKFIFKVDPRDISVIYFFDPDISQYFQIPYRNTSLPPITMWEHREIIKELKRKGMQNVDEQKIFEAYRRMKEIEQNAVQTTRDFKKSVRKTYAIHKSILKEHAPATTSINEISVPNITYDIIKPFEDIDHDPFR